MTAEECAASFLESCPSSSKLTFTFIYFRAELMPASGKKAAKRAARQVYNSDDEAEEADEPASKPKVLRSGAPDKIEGQEEDATLSELEADSDDELEEGPLDDLRAVERRMRNSARVLGNWKELGASSGK